MNRRQKIIVNITGIFIVLLALVGLTYAYFLTRITGNENDKSISVTTANLELVYGDDDGSIIGNNEIIEPGKKFATKTFTVTNNGNTIINDYAVILENVSTTYASAFKDKNNNQIAADTPTSFKRPEDFKIKITCSSLKDDLTSECTGYSGTLPIMENEAKTEKYITNGILLTNSIEVGEVQTYSVELEYVEADLDQSDDMNKRLEGRFNIIDTKNTVDITGTVDDYDIGDKVVTNSVRRESQINSDGSYKIVGLEATIHSIKINDTEIDKISIVKGETAGIGTTLHNGETIKQITITDLSREAMINIQNDDVKISEEIKDLSINPFKEGTLAYEILNNAKLALEENSTTKTIYSATPISTIGSSSESNERTLSEISENDGISYYFRGNIYDNYLTFNNMCWRIVRIENDGSVKIILEDEYNPCGALPLGSIFKKDVAYANYGYLIKDNIMAEPDFFSERENSMKNVLDKWYNNNLSSKKDLLKEDTWCLGYSDEYRYEIDNGQYNLISQSYIDEKYNQVLNSIGTEEPYMFTYYYNDFVKLDSNKLNNLDCENQETFSSKIGGITASEVTLAGVGQSNWDNVKNYSYLTQHPGETFETFFATITPSYFDFFPDEQTEDVPIPFFASVYVYHFSEENNNTHYGLVSGTFPIMDDFSIRPMITLKNSIKVKRFEEFDTHESICVECFENRYFYTIEE